MTSRTQTEFADPIPVLGTDSGIDELRVLTNRRYDHGGDLGEGNAPWILYKLPLFHSNVNSNQKEIKVKSTAQS